MSDQAEIDILLAQCYATISRRTSSLLWLDYHSALELAEKAGNMAREARLGPATVSRCENYRTRCETLIRQTLPSVDGRDGAFEDQRGLDGSTFPGAPADIVATATASPAPDGREAQENIGRAGVAPQETRPMQETLVGRRDEVSDESPGRAQISQSPDTVRICDEHGNVVSTKQRPKLRQKAGQSFDGWRNII
jgi:hypothetical protein